MPGGESSFLLSHAQELRCLSVVPVKHKYRPPCMAHGLLLIVQVQAEVGVASLARFWRRQRLNDVRFADDESVAADLGSS